jgi:hypothetical protein
MKRTLYFLRDSVSGSYYNGNLPDGPKKDEGFVEFDCAPIFVNEKNVKTKLKYLVEKWVWAEGCLPVWKKEKRCVGMDKMVTQRKDLPNWGIEIVTVELSVK